MALTVYSIDGMRREWARARDVMGYCCRCRVLIVGAA